MKNKQDWLEGRNASIRTRRENKRTSIYRTQLRMSCLEPRGLQVVTEHSLNLSCAEPTGTPGKVVRKPLFVITVK